MIDLEYIKSMREFLIERGTFTIPYLKYSINNTKNHKFLSAADKEQLISCYNILLEELVDN